MPDSNGQQPTTTNVDDPFLSRIFRRKQDSNPQNKPPWEDWELDKEFFRALSRWTLQNPETSLDRVLDQISSGLENNKDLIQLIPESPFPARGLVTALAHLFKLGVKVARAKRDVQEFAKDLIRWVGRVKSAFESSEDGRFTWQAWRNLADTRNLINEVCTWAVKRLEDGSWWQIGRKFAIQTEIQEFKARLSDARALFRDLSLITQAKGLDLIMQNLQQSFDRQGIVISEIQRIRETQKMQFDEIEMQKQVAERERFLTRTLNVHTVADPTYVNQGKRPCDDDTRIKVLEEIRGWKDDTNSGSPNFLWLTGDPGCGKSAVTASLARECKDQDVLWAQFFINRNNAETTNPKSYFPSIVRQLASRSPEIAEAIHQMLKHQPSLLDDISHNQAAKLFTDSVRQASELDPDRPVVVIIDGLDETNRARLDFTAKTFATLFTTLEAYKNVKVFISSRTENEIQKSFFHPSNDKHVKHIHLDTADPSSIQDVTSYIKRGLLNLVSEHDLDWDVWPGDERAWALGERASGLFIWGVTAIKFIEEQLQSHGEECLDYVLNTLTADALHDINSLYVLILRATVGRKQDGWEVERFRRIVGTIVCLQEPLCLDDLATFLDLRKTPSSKQVDIVHFVRRFRTILVSGTDTITGTTIPRIHKSVFEFVTSNSAGPAFRVELSDAHLELGIQCFAYLGTARSKSLTGDSLPVMFRYASRFWISHLTQAKITGHATAFVDNNPFARSFPPPLQSIGSLRKPMHVQYSAPMSEIRTVTTYSSSAWDALSGTLISPHTSEITCIVFTPDGRQVVSCSHDGTIQCWDPINGVWIGTLVKYSSSFLAIAFSPNGKSIVSGSEDGLVHLWDYPTGAPIGNPFRAQGQNSHVCCVAFSPLGDLIVSAYAHGSCILWNAQTGLAVGKPWIADPEQAVRRVVFSSSGRRLCSIGDDGHCIIWDVSTGQKVGVWKSITSNPTCVSFSPKDDDIIAVGGRDGVQIALPSHNEKWSIPGPSIFVRCLSFSPDGKEITFCSHGILSVAKIEKDKPAVQHYGYTTQSRDVQLMVLSPDLTSIVYSASTNKISVFQLSKTTTKAIPTGGLAETDAYKELMDALLNIRAVQHRHTTAIVTDNSRLNAIKWCERDDDNAIKSDIQMCVVKDTAIIAGYKDGSVMIWERHIEDEEKDEEKEQT